jgi:MFS family permease
VIPTTLELSMTTPAASLPTDSSQEPPADPRSRQRKAFLPALAIANSTIWIAFFTPVVLTLPLRVEHLSPDGKARTLSIVLLISSIFGLISNPLAGRLSDRTTSRWGMRRPWLAGGMAVGFVGFVVMAIAPTVPILVVGSSLSQIGFATTLTVLLALLPEQVPSARRGLVGAVLGVGQAVAVVVGVGIAGALQGTPLLAFTVPGLIGIAGVTALCATLSDRVLDFADRIPLRGREILDAFWRDPRTYPDFGWAWLSRFMIFLAFAAVLTYQVFYLTDQLGIATDRTAKYIAMALGLQVVMVILSSLVSGPLSDRVGRRKPFVIGAALLGVVALLCIAVATSLPLYLIGMVIGGIAQGTYFSVDLALIADVLPDRDHDAARDFGIMTIASVLPQTILPGLAPGLLAVGFGSVVAGSTSNYTALFVGSAFFAAISAVAITRVRGSR